MADPYDVAIIGAGPAGMAAAGRATRAGARAVVIDSSPRVGGQFWRHRPEDADNLSTLHSGRASYRRLKSGFEAALTSGALTHLPSTSVWMSHSDDDGFALHLTAEDPQVTSPAQIRARALVVATGAYDRQLPIPGWDLPGVMAAGGIQGFIKQSGFAPANRFLIAGTGPFLLPVALNITQAGARVAAICESSRMRAWSAHLHRAVRVPSKLVEGARFSVSLAAERIPYRTAAVVTEILGDGRVEAARVSKVNARGEPLPGTERLVSDIDGVGLGWGFTPQIDIPVQLGAATRLGADGSLIVVADARGATDVPGLFVAGEVAGVAGATVSALEGARAGAAAADYSAWSSTGTRVSAAPAGARVTNHRRFAEAMHTVHRVPAAWRTWVPDPCVVCRCEEVTAGEIRGARNELGATDQRSSKGVTRAGMGWCQGKVCAFAVSGLAENTPPGLKSLRRAARRPIARPVSLDQIAELPDEPGT